MTTKMEVASGIARIVADIMGITSAEVFLHHDLRSDLGADDLDIVEISVTIEEEYSVRFSDEVLDAIKDLTVEQLVRIVLENRPDITEEDSPKRRRTIWESAADFLAVSLMGWRFAPSPVRPGGRVLFNILGAEVCSENDWVPHERPEQAMSLLSEMVAKGWSASVTKTAAGFRVALAMNGTEAKAADGKLEPAVVLSAALALGFSEKGGRDGLH